MLGDECFSHITTPFDLSGSHPNHLLFVKTIENTLRKILPPNFCKPIVADPDFLDDQRKELDALLPIITSSLIEKTEKTISFYSLSKFRQDSFKFFLEMISQWLIPGKKLNLSLVYSLDFHIPLLGKERLSLAEIVISVETEKEIEEIQRNFPIMQTELRLGIYSSYYARRILEIKGISIDAKTAMIQENIARIISRFPKSFDYDLLTEMQHILVTCSDDFKEKRYAHHLNRLITAQYSFRRKLLDSVKKQPERRHLNLKLFKTPLQSHEGEKSILGVVVGVNFLQDNEIFEERHLLAAIQNYVPNAHAVPGSFFSSRRGNENVCTLYLEIEKSTGEPLTSKEIRTLQNELPSDLKDRIEHLMHPIFMTRNEEEIMRNILTLNNQIKYIHDMPQVIISFDKQSHADLFFVVILVKVMKPGDANVADIFNLFEVPFEYIHDRVKTVGFLRKKYMKEATVFGIKVSKDQFLRRDSSIDLNKARQFIVDELVKIFGEIRDFNGGMISKQNELLCSIRESLDDQIKYNDLLLENFFYSLTPDVMRTVLEPSVLKTLFQLLLESIEDGLFSGQDYHLKIKREAGHVFVMIKSEESNLREMMSKAFRSILPAKLGSSLVLVYDISYLGYLYICDDANQQQAFCDMIEAEILKIQKHPQELQLQMQLQF